MIVITIIIKLVSASILSVAFERGSNLFFTILDTDIVTVIKAFFSSRTRHTHTLYIASEYIVSQWSTGMLLDYVISGLA